MDASTWLTGSLIFLAAAVLAVPIAKALGLGSVMGYLVAGMAIGPWGLGLVRDGAQILSFSEFGVVLMLFLVGLDLEPRRLWALRVPIFGWGSVQLVGCTLLMMGAGLLAGTSWQLSLVAAFGLAMSSTAIALGVLGERHLLARESGRAVLSVSLFQDVASIPFLALVPLLGAVAVTGADPGGGSTALKAVVAVAGVIFGGRLLLRPVLRWIARSDSREIFTAASLLLVVAIAALMQSIGLSMALGAFLAGVLLADSEYRRELQTDLEPFRGLLMGLFFIAVGLGIDFGVVAARPGWIALLLAGFLLIKLVVMWAIARWMPIPKPERAVFMLLLAQGGEFGFVVFQAGAQVGVLDAAAHSVLVATVALSMLLTPLLLRLAERWMPTQGTTRPDLPELSDPQEAPVILAGFGRYGQIIGRLLFANGVNATVLDHDPEQVEVVRRFGWRVHYGDATRLDLLRTAGAGTARVLVIAVDDIEQSLAIADLARDHFPHLQVVARARNVTHWYELRQRGVTHIERETLDSALMSARTVLEKMGWEPHHARELALRFRRHTIDQLEQQLPHYKDQARLIAIAKQGRQQLETLFAQERQSPEERRREGWGE
ncbi:glutathione-regulated potassium-efflux system protein KefC [Caldimonas caldifontis]|uniref:Glutathione-regulated potassium-efflux system protein KefC n=1 Tax=Caldimonas caldifontis TaxID=1452508 RepID=A0A2S5SZ41_9BURK|nr:glutathione-regulated potassium-efflux system protein KefC [Caldimonas caldifontis]PPE68035.1 glutathione-regulated potassium-efflux system protein KefC [Caldimonas caldifontis]